jgi:hypothetical protein
VTMGSSSCSNYKNSGASPPSHLIYLFIHLVSMSGSRLMVSPPLVICKILQ